MFLEEQGQEQGSCYEKCVIEQVSRSVTKSLHYILHFRFVKFSLGEIQNEPFLCFEFLWAENVVAVQR